jgi:hypothetical protein
MFFSWWWIFAFLNLKNMISKHIHRIFVKKIGPTFARFQKKKKKFQQVAKIEMDS